MYGYIYMTINQINGKIYVGKHKSEVFDENYYGSGIALKSAMNKYGKDNFFTFMLRSAETLEELNELEKICIKELHAQDNQVGYNIAPGGDGGEVWGDPQNHPSLGKHGLQGDKNPMYGKHLSDEAKERVKKALAGRKRIVKDNKWKLVHPDEIEKYIADGWRCPSNENKMKEISEKETHPKKKHAKGWHHSEESKQKISESIKKINSNLDFREKQSQKIKEAWANMPDEKRELFKQKRKEIQTGKSHSEESKRKLSETLKKGHMEGKYRTTKGKTAWNKGKKLSEEERTNLSQIPKGRIHITNGEINKMIYPEELPEWELKGFKKGRTIYKNKEELLCTQ